MQKVFKLKKYYTRLIIMPLENFNLINLNFRIKFKLQAFY